MESLRQSPLHDCHLNLSARMVPFAGWEMPVQYEGIIPESRAVRTSLGVFDISHMGQLVVSAAEADTVVSWLDRMLTNNVSSLNIGQGRYTLLLTNEGGVIDDLIIYRQSENSFFLVVNASKTTEDFEWLTAHVVDGIRLEDLSSRFAAVAVQGPEAVQAFPKICGTDAVLPDRFCMTTFSTGAGDVVICRTGYTGEDGYEIFCPVGDAATWWQKCLDAGAVPAGLGARDLLRLEKCYPLNGNDLSPQHTPLEAGLAFAVDLHKPEFIGRETLVRQKASGLNERLVAIRQTEKAPPPRPGYVVYCGETDVGVLTSGGVSPALGCGIGMAYLKAGSDKPGTMVELEIRGKRYPAEVVKKPFL